MAALAQILISLGPIINWVLDQMKIKKEKREWWDKVYDRITKDGRIPIQHADRFDKLHDELEKQKPK